MADSKVVIKINYDKHKLAQTLNEPKTVTVWHIPRILAALAVLLLLISLASLLFRDDKHTIDQPADLNQQTFNQNYDKENMRDLTQSDKSADDKTVNSIEKIMHQGHSKIKTNSAIIFDRNVIRASLNTELKDNEPYAPLKSQLELAQNQKIELFYFTQLKRLNNEELFHYWTKNGKTLYKKPLTRQAGHLKLHSAQTLSYKDKGVWVIQLVNQHGKIYSEATFTIETE